MKKVLSLLLTTLLITASLRAQSHNQDTTNQSVFTKNSKTTDIFLIDTTLLEFKYTKSLYRGLLLLHANKKIIDTITLKITSYIPDFENNRLIWIVQNNNKDDIYYFNLHTFKFKYNVSIPHRNYQGLINGHLVAPVEITEPEHKKEEPENEVSGGIKDSWELEKVISFYDTITGNESEVIDISEYTIDEFEDIEGITISPNAGKILFDIGIYESGAYSNRRYLVYDLISKKIIIKKYNENKLIKYKNCEIFLYNPFYDLNGHFYMKNYLDTNSPDNMLVLDENFDIKDTLLRKSTENIGFIYKNKKIKGFYFYSNTDIDDKEVIIPAIMTYHFEKLQSNIYYNIRLKKDDLINYNLNELKLLKNMIFAKHNYKFDSRYYQAYFNLYSFYHSPDKQKTRTKNINHLLSPTDLENLKLINTIIKLKSKKY